MSSTLSNSMAKTCSVGFRCAKATLASVLVQAEAGPPL
jgi:hypothetical protein